MTEAQRRKINNRHLGELHPAFRKKVAAVLSDLEGHGYFPYIADAWRSPAEQERKFIDGVSKVRYSFHNATSSDGNPESLAADIVNMNQGWNSAKKFWLMLGSSAGGHDLYWGGYFGLDGAEEALLAKALLEGNWKFGGKLGWDLAHLQFYSNSKLSAVRKGLRPT